MLQLLTYFAQSTYVCQTPHRLSQKLLTNFHVAERYTLKDFSTLDWFGVERGPQIH